MIQREEKLLFETLSLLILGIYLFFREFHYVRQRIEIKHGVQHSHVFSCHPGLQTFSYHLAPVLL